MRVFKGMRRTHGKPPRRVAALEIGTLKAGLVGYTAPWPPERRLRDVTLLSLGFFGALRRGELLALCVEDIEFVAEGMVITRWQGVRGVRGLGLPPLWSHHRVPDRHSPAPVG